jgi:Zn finger protein HypA/HybF involved in hydrogenase expression
MAIMCISCKDNWQQERNGLFKCPTCSSDKQPRNLNKMEQFSINNIPVFCSNQQCQKDEEMTFEKP